MIKLKDIDGVIFDMDGVLIDSEPLWKIALEEVFQRVGCNLTKKDFQKTVGMRIDEVIAYWYSVCPWEGKSQKAVEQEIIERMVELISENAQPLTGVVESLEFFKSKGKKIGLATSSYQKLLEVVLTSLKIETYFDYTYSAEHEKYGKPHPSVYLHVAEKLQLNPRKCLVIEDSLTGVIAGKSARMTVYCVPEKTHRPEPKLILADAQFESLNLVIKSFS